MTDRLPPHSIEAEQGVLGCCLLSPKEVLGDALEALQDSKAFYDLRHQGLFETLRAMEAARVAIDPITVQEELRKAGTLDSMGGLAYLSQLMDAVPSAAHLPEYVRIVLEKHQLRRWIALCTETVGKCYEEQEDVAAFTGKISTALFALCETGQKMAERKLNLVLAEVQENVLETFQRGVKRRVGPMTGFNFLDNIIPGFAPADLIVLAARPGMGKSALAMQFAENIAGVEKVPVAFFSLEMSARSLGTRAAFQRGGVDLMQFLNGFKTSSDDEKLATAMMDLCRLPIYIDDSSGLALEDLEIRARRMKRQYGIGIIFIDYFQLLWMRGRHHQWSRADELGKCSVRLKALAKELNIPIFLCAQLNREIEKERHRKPRLSDLRDTGQLEQDADKVLFLYEPDLSSDRNEKKIDDILSRVPVPAQWRTRTEKLKTAWKEYLMIVSCYVAKQREGPSNKAAALVFIKPWVRFVDAYATPVAAESGPVKQPEQAQMLNEEEEAE